MFISWSVVFEKFNRWLFPHRSALFKRTRTKILLYFHESKGKELQKHAFILSLSSWGNKNIKKNSPIKFTQRAVRPRVFQTFSHYSISSYLFPQLMHEDGYETRQVLLFHVFVHIFGLDPAQNTPFLKEITNQILRLNYAHLICEPVRSENKRLCRVTVNSTSIATLFSLLKGFKVS